MEKKAKTAQSLSSNKKKLEETAALLPEKSVKDTVSPGPENLEKKISSPEEITGLVDQIKATGALKNIYCNLLNFGLTRSKRSALTSEQMAMVEDPLNRIEVKILEWLPEYIRKHADKGGPGIDLLVATGMIIWAKNQEVKSKKPVEKPVTPVEKPFNPLDPIKTQEEIKVRVT